jgi:putative SOS response-associated peptidase YedK
MCGRYTIIHNIEAVADRFGVQAPSYATVGPSYNVAPTDGVPIIVAERERREMLLAHWGLVPFWAKDPDIGSRLINARAETLAEKASFKYALTRRRCLIPADGFYEWQAVDGTKQPYYIRLKDGSLFAFAGLWETWESPDGSPLISCTIITVEPNALVAPIHNRMPAILKPDEEPLWLFGTQSTGESAQRKGNVEAQMMKLLRPYPADLMEAYPVAKSVGNPANNSPRCVEPIAARS